MSSSDTIDVSTASAATHSRYDEYADSGVEWLGEVPAHWDVLSLKYAAQIIQDKLDEKPENLPYLGLEHIESETGRLVKEEPAEGVSSTVRHFKEGDVLFSKLRPYLAKVYLAETEGVGTTELIALRSKVEICEKYLAYQLLSKGFIDRVDSMTYGAKMPRVSPEQVGARLIALPSFDEQRAIAAFLDRETERIDALIEKKERLIDLLEEMRATEVLAVATGRNNESEFKWSGYPRYGDIPEEWRVSSLKWIADIDYGHTVQLDRTATEGVPIISLPNVSKSGQLDLEDVPFADLSSDELEGTLLRPGDLLFNWRSGSADHVGKTAYFDEDGVYTHVSFLLRIRFDREDYNPRYFQMLFNGLRGAGYFSAAKNKVNRTFNQTELGNLKIVVPSKDEQDRIASYLHKRTARIDTLVRKVKEGIVRLKEYRAALISAAVTGQIDVREKVQL